MIHLHRAVLNPGVLFYEENQQSHNASKELEAKHKPQNVFEECTLSHDLMGVWHRLENCLKIS